MLLKKTDDIPPILVRKYLWKRKSASAELPWDFSFRVFSVMRLSENRNGLIKRIVEWQLQEKNLPLKPMIPGAFLVDLESL